MDIKDLEIMARIELDAHRLPQWTFGLDSAKRRFGQCDYPRRRITMSASMVEVNDVMECRHTLLHEIAHALAFVEHGRAGSGHGRAWKDKCAEIGIAATVYWSDPSRSVVPAKPRYTLRCSNCSSEVGTHRRPRGWISCTTCHPYGFSADYLMEVIDTNGQG